MRGVVGISYGGIGPSEDERGGCIVGEGVAFCWMYLGIPSPFFPAF